MTSADDLFAIYMNQGAEGAREHLAGLCEECLHSTVAEFLVAAIPCPQCCIEIAIEALRRHAEAALHDEFGELPT